MRCTLPRGIARSLDVPLLTLFSVTLSLRQLLSNAQYFHLEAMINAEGKTSRIFRVLALSLMLLHLAHASSSKNSTIVEEPKTLDVKAAKVVEKEPTKIDNGKVEARWEEDTPVVKLTKSSGWKSGRVNWNKDSYLEAFKHSRTSTDPREGVIAGDKTSNSGPTSFQRRKEYVPGPVYLPKEQGDTSPRIVHSSYDRDSFSMVPSDSYSLPTKGSGDFGGVQNSYGPPHSPQSSYGPPHHHQDTYGPPQPPRVSYGPPSNGYPSYGDYSGGVYQSPQQAYGPPASSYGVPYGHGTPSGMAEVAHILPTIDFSWPFALKLNAFTLAKILLKLVIFKMIVKFIAVICLLLFIPKLEIKKKGNKDDMDDDDEGRRLFDADSWISERLNLLTLIVHNAVEKYQHLNEERSNSTEGCSTVSCRIGQAFSHSSWEDYRQLLKSYVLEESRSIRAKS
ncbi:uncharacterized protein LOC143183421 [Calliopsis andreniformis]|uniref:uncharacterized protein LOC143183421 n=1 Tax=Calliopsis andreniformis TaxID=337506 RepID=UPI003FCE61F2